MTDTKQHWLSNKSIVISGAGIAGCTFAISLAQLCHQHNIRLPTITIYEREVDINARAGYSLGLRSDKASGGIQILQKLNLLNALLPHSNQSGYFTLFDHHFNPLLMYAAPDVEDVPVNSFRIARRILRNTLIDAVPNSITIHYGCGVSSAAENNDNTVICTLSDNSTINCDILIAADGSKSKIRESIRRDKQLQFNGGIILQGNTTSYTSIPKPLDETFGIIFAENGHFCFVASTDKTSCIWSVVWYSAQPVVPQYAATMTTEQISDLLQQAHTRTKHVDTKFHRLIDDTDRSTVALVNAMECQPFHNHGSIIFIGDANHAMSPFSGNGANMAIMDGYQLAEQMCVSNDLSTAIIEYDKIAIPRSEHSIATSHKSLAAGTITSILRYLLVQTVKIAAWWFGKNRKPSMENKVV